MLSSDMFLSPFIPHGLCPLINHHVLPVLRILDFKQMRIYLDSNPLFPQNTSVLSDVKGVT